MYEAASYTRNFSIVKKNYPLQISCPSVALGTPVNTTIVNNPENFDVTITYYSYDPVTEQEIESFDPPTAIGEYYVEATTSATEEYSQGHAYADFEITAETSTPTPDPTPVVSYVPTAPEEISRYSIKEEKK